MWHCRESVRWKQSWKSSHRTIPSAIIMRRNAQKTAPFVRSEAKVLRKFFVFFLPFFGVLFSPLEWMHNVWFSFGPNFLLILFFKIQLKWKFIQFIFSLFLLFSISRSLRTLCASEHIFQYQSKKDDDTETPNLDYVLDVTVAYPDNGTPLDLPTIVTGTRPPCKTHFLYRLYHSSEVSEEVSAQFLPIYRIQSKRFASNGTSFFSCNLDPKRRKNAHTMAIRSLVRKGAIFRGILSNRRISIRISVSTNGCRTGSTANADN